MTRKLSMAGFATVVFTVAMVATTALAEEKYTLSYVEKVRLDDGTIVPKFVHKKASINEVLEALHSPDPDIRLRVAKSFLWPEDWPVEDRKAIVQGMGTRLSDDEPGVKFWVSQSLVRVGPDAIAILPLLIESAGDEDEDTSVRVRAIGAIGNIGPDAETAVPTLTKLLESEERFIPVSAAYALAGIGEKGLAVLVASLESEKPSTRINSIQAIHSMGDYAKSAVPDLKQLAEKEEDRLFQFQIRRAIELAQQPESSQLWYSIYGKNQTTPPESQKK